MGARFIDELDKIEVYWVVILFGLILWQAWLFLKNLKRYSIIKYKPTIPIASAHAGYIKVEGIIQDKDNAITPFGKRACCYWVAKVEAHWEETDWDENDNSSTTEYSEIVYSYFTSADWIIIKDKTGSIRFSTEGELLNMKTDGWTKTSLNNTEAEKIDGDREYDYYTFDEYWFNHADQVTALGQMDFEYHGRGKNLYLEKPKNVNKPFLLTTMTSKQFDRFNKLELMANLKWALLALFFLIDTFYFKSMVATTIVMVLAWVVYMLITLVTKIFN